MIRQTVDSSMLVPTNTPGVTVYRARQEKWISLAGDDGDFGTGPDTVSARSRA